MTQPRCVLPAQTHLVTRRCIGRRFLLRPDEALTNAFLYCLARATTKYGVEIHGFCAMSNHYHLVLTDSEGVLPDFMAWLNRQLAMCVRQLRRWDEVVWEPNRSYNAVELGGPTEVLDKMAYVLLNPVTAALVRSPERWAGAVSTLRFLNGETIRAKRPAVWFKNDAPEAASLKLTPAPCFSGKVAYLNALEALVAERLTQVRVELRRQGRGFLGATRVQRTPPTDQPRSEKARLGRNPTFSAMTRDMWLTAVRRLRAFRRAYRAAYEAWRKGDRSVLFPAGTWWLVRCAGATAVT